MLVSPTSFVAGILGPVASFALSGVPGAVMLSFMMVELAGYGLAAGFARSWNTSLIVKLLAAQLAGRFLRAAALAAAGLVTTGVPPVVSVLSATGAGLPGLCLQWLLIPAILLAVKAQSVRGAARD